MSLTRNLKTSNLSLWASCLLNSGKFIFIKLKSKSHCIPRDSSGGSRQGLPLWDFLSLKGKLLSSGYDITCCTVLTVCKGPMSWRPQKHSINHGRTSHESHDHKREGKRDKYNSLNSPLRSGYGGPGKVAGVHESKKTQECPGTGSPRQSPPTLR